MGIGSAWLPSRKSTLHQVGAVVIARDGHWHAGSEHNDLLPARQIEHGDEKQRIEDAGDHQRGAEGDKAELIHQHPAAQPGTSTRARDMGEA